jgi:membrane protein required for colicin V production
MLGNRRMTEMSLTVFDLAVFFVLVVSVLLALARGLLREGLGLLAWAGAGVVAWFGLDDTRTVLQQQFANDTVAEIAAFGLVFVVPLVLFKLLALLLGAVIPGGAFGSIDRLLGAGFGFVRGAAVVSAVYLALAIVITPENHPAWIRDAYFLPYVQDGAELLADFVPEDILSSDALANLSVVDGRGSRVFDNGLLSPPEQPGALDQPGSLEPLEQGVVAN